MGKLRNVYSRLTVQFAEYLIVNLYGFYSHVSLTTAGDIIFDTYFILISDLLSIVQKHTNLRYTRLSDIIVYDRPQYRMRFTVSYVLLNPLRENKLRIRYYSDAFYAVSPSVVSLFSSANWAEREAMDLFGVKFNGHPDLRRILGDYGMWGFPCRKDFPLVGHFSYFYSINYLRVFKVKGTISDFWSLYFQKKIYD